MSSEKIRQCRRCLLKDMDGQEYFRTVYEYIESLDPEIRTPEPEYRRRLSLCRECDCLINGMCRLCGCFVESRAAKVQSRCAASPEKW